MKARFTLLFATLIVVSAAARADVLTHFLVDTGVRLLGKASQAVVSTVAEAIIPKETDEERIARENAEMEQAAEQILAQYPEDEREARKPEVMMQLARVYAQHKTIEARQEAIRAEQNSIGSILVDSAESAISNRMAIDRAARSVLK